MPLLTSNSLCYLSRKIPKTCEKSFAHYSIDYEKLSVIFKDSNHDRNELTQCPVSNNGFLPVRFGMVTGLSIVWPRSLLFLFHNKVRIREKSFGFCQTDNTQISFIMHCYTYRQLVEIWK